MSWTKGREPTIKSSVFHDHILIGTIVCLAFLVFLLDLFLPLAVAEAVLYGGVVLLAGAVATRPRLPVVVAAACTFLTFVGTLVGPVYPGVPLWLGVSNRIISLVAIWAPVAFIYQRRRAEVRLREANESLERRVDERTSALTTSEQALKRSQEALHALTGRILTAQEEERRRISRDLHDDINQRLALLTLGLQSVEKQAGVLSQEARDSLSSVLGGLVSLSDDVRHLAYRFHPSILDDLGLETALQRLLDEFSTRTHIKVLFVHQSLPALLSKDIATALYRVVQECLSNVTRHAKATRVEVELTGDERLIELMIRDDGVGFDMEAMTTSQRGLGLLNAQERLLVFHGICEVHSEPGKGTRVHARIPTALGAP
ncbi:MAG: sensor histidine kinase [Nitrospira sp.]